MRAWGKTTTKKKELRNTRCSRGHESEPECLKPHRVLTLQRHRAAAAEWNSSCLLRGSISKFKERYHHNCANTTGIPVHTGTRDLISELPELEQHPVSDTLKIICSQSRFKRSDSAREPTAFENPQKRNNLPNATDIHTVVTSSTALKARHSRLPPDVGPLSTNKRIIQHWAQRGVGTGTHWHRTASDEVWNETNSTPSVPSVQETRCEFVSSDRSPPSPWEPRLSASQRPSADSGWYSSEQSNNSEVRPAGTGKC